MPSSHIFSCVFHHHFEIKNHPLIVLFDPVFDITLSYSYSVPLCSEIIFKFSAMPKTINNDFVSTFMTKLQLNPDSSNPR